MATKRQVDLQNAMIKMRDRVSIEKQREAVQAAQRKLRQMRVDFTARNPTRKKRVK